MGTPTAAARPAEKRQKGIDTALDQLSRRGPLAVLRRPILGVPARRDPRPGRPVLHALPDLLVGQRRRRAVLGRALCPARLLRRAERGEGLGYASDAILGLILVAIVVLAIRHHRKEKEEIEGPRTSELSSTVASPPSSSSESPSAAAPMTQSDQAGPPRTERSPARSPATTRANSPAGVVAHGVGVHEAHGGGVTPIHSEQAVAGLVGAPLVVVHQRPVEVGGHRALPTIRRRPPRPGARGRSAVGPCRPRAGPPARRASASPCRSRRPTAGVPAAAPTRSDTRRATPPGAIPRPSRPG